MLSLLRTTARSAVPLLVAALALGIVARAGLAPAGLAPLAVLGAAVAVLWWWESTMLSEGLRALARRADLHELGGRDVLRAFRLNPLALVAHPAGGTLAYAALSAQVVLTLDPADRSPFGLLAAALLGGFAGRALAGAAALRYVLPRIGDRLADELRSAFAR